VPFALVFEAQKAPSSITPSLKNGHSAVRTKEVMSMID